MGCCVEEILFRSNHLPREICQPETGQTCQMEDPGSTLVVDLPTTQLTGIRHVLHVLDRRMMLPSPSRRTMILALGGAVFVLVVVVILGLRWRASSGLDPQEGGGAAEQGVVTVPVTTSTTDSVQGMDAPQDPAMNDQDGDGLTDIREREIGTDPLLRDTDGDGVSDEEEVQLGTDPLALPERPPEPVVTNVVQPPVPESAPPQSLLTLDQDEDGIPDEKEGLYGTNVLQADTDGDGFGDAKEIQNGYNPLGPGLCSRPDCQI